MNAEVEQAKVPADAPPLHPAVEGFDQSQLKAVARILVEGDAVPMLQQATARQFNFKKPTVALRMHMVEYGDGWARFEDRATGYGRVLLDMEKQTSTLDEMSWDKHLMAAFRKLPAKPDEDEIRAAQELISKTRDSAWFKRKLWALEALYRRVAAQGHRGGVSEWELVPTIKQFLQEDRLAFEEKELMAAGAGSTIPAWADAITTALCAAMLEVQDAEFRKHDRYMDGLALAEQALCDTNSVWRAAAAVRLKVWAAEVDDSRFVARASSLKLVMEEARQLAE